MSLQGVAFSWENDLFVPASRSSDRWYTNGLHGAWSYQRDGELPAAYSLVRDVARDFFGVRSDTGSPTAAGFLGQNMYTPRRITSPEQQVNDRPWAGQLAIGLGAFAYEGDIHRSLEARLGWVGPAALAGPVQRGWHDLIGADRPAGWGLQVRPRALIQGSYTQTYRFAAPSALPDWAGFQMHGRATLGTVKNSLSAGATFVAGETRRILGAPDEGDFYAVDFNERYRANRFPTGLQWLTVFGQVQGSLVGSNYLITGRTFGEPQPRIELRRSTWMATLGASIRLSKSFRVEYLYKRRSPEFTLPAAVTAMPDRYQTYGEVRLVFDFDFDVKPVEERPL